MVKIINGILKKEDITHCQEMTFLQLRRQMSQQCVQVHCNEITGHVTT